MFLFYPATYPVGAKTHSPRGDGSRVRLEHRTSGTSGSIYCSSPYCTAIYCYTGKCLTLRMRGAVPLLLHTVVKSAKCEKYVNLGSEGLQLNKG